MCYYTVDMYIKMRKQLWHSVDTIYGTWLKTACGKDFNLPMCRTVEEEEDCDGPICRQCLRSVRKAALLEGSQKAPQSTP